MGVVAVVAGGEAGEGAAPAGQVAQGVLVVAPGFPDRDLPPTLDQVRENTVWVSARISPVQVPLGVSQVIPNSSGPVEEPSRRPLLVAEVSSTRRF